MIKREDIVITAVNNEPIAPHSPHEALYFAVMRTAAYDYQAAWKAGNKKKMAGAERFMREMASDGCVDTILRMIHSGVEIAKASYGGVS